MINAIIFSKDKACQLELLLRSIRRNTSNLFDIKVIYEASNGVFNQGYEKLKEETFYHTKRDVNFPVRWHERTEDNISLDILNILNEDRDLMRIYSSQALLLTGRYLIYSGRSRLRPYRLGLETILSFRILTLQRIILLISLELESFCSTNSCSGTLLT